LRHKTSFERAAEKSMHGRILIAASFAVLAACGPSTPPKTPTPSTSAACNQVAPNLAIAAMMRGETIAAAAMPKLEGGHIAPGLYDLANGEQLDGAPSWDDTRSVSLRVSDAPAGPLFEWAQLAGPDQATRTDWTAQLHSGPPATLVFTCGRTGTTAISFSTAESELHLRLADPSGTGVLDLVFIRHPS
jgi:hypothetical protein